MKKIYWIIGVVILLIIFWVLFIMPKNNSTQKVIVFFTKSEATQIITVGVERDIVVSNNLETRLEKTINQLLLGLNLAEKDQDLYSAINAGTKLNSVKIVGKIATLDFNETLDYQVGGSAKVLAIREQLEKTVLQFSFVNQLILTVNEGAREAILEP